MAFKIAPFYNIDNTPIYRTLAEDGVLGIANKNGTIRVKINPKYYRPCEVDLLLGNAKKAEKELGWKREFDTLDKLIEDMFN